MPGDNAVIIILPIKTTRKVEGKRKREGVNTGVIRKDRDDENAMKTRVMIL